MLNEADPLLLLLFLNNNLTSCTTTCRRCRGTCCRASTVRAAATTSRATATSTSTATATWRVARAGVPSTRRYIRKHHDQEDRPADVQRVAARVLATGRPVVQPDVRLPVPARFAGPRGARRDVLATWVRRLRSALLAPGYPELA